jgi:hypothetical protein
VSNFHQIAVAKECMQVLGCRAQHEGAMSKADQFWQYAREAILFACNVEADQEKQGLFYLARTWTQAALLERATSSSDYYGRGKISAA